MQTRFLPVHQERLKVYGFGQPEGKETWYIEHFRSEREREVIRTSWLVQGGVSTVPCNKTHNVSSLRGIVNDSQEKFGIWAIMLVRKDWATIIISPLRPHGHRPSRASECHTDQEQ